MVHFTLADSLRLVGRVMAALLAALWAIFFVEHLAWFGVWPLPPVRIWIAQLAHLTLVIGLIVSAVRHELAGSATAVSAAAVLMIAAGFSSIPWLFWITVTPALLFAAAHAAGWRTPGAVAR